MTWSYDPTDLATNAKDQVRWYIGDTDSAYPQLQDEEITFAISLRGNNYGAAALCCRALAAKYSRLVSMSADGASSQFSNLPHQFAILALEYEAKETVHNAAPYAGGTSQADMQAQLQNSDRVPDIFRFGLFDNPPNDGTNTALDQPGGGPEQGLGVDGDNGLVA